MWTYLTSTVSVIVIGKPSTLFKVLYGTAYALRTDNNTGIPVYACKDFHVVCVDLIVMTCLVFTV